MNTNLNKKETGFFNVLSKEPLILKISIFIFFGSFVVLFLYGPIVLENTGIKNSDSFHTMGIPMRGEGTIYYPTVVGLLFYLIIALCIISFIILVFYSLLKK